MVILSDNHEQVGEPEVGGWQPGDFLSELQQGVHRHQPKGQSQNGEHGGKIEIGIMWSYTVPMIAQIGRGKEETTNDVDLCSDLIS